MYIKSWVGPDGDRCTWKACFLWIWIIAGVGIVDNNSLQSTSWVYTFKVNEMKVW